VPDLPQWAVDDPAIAGRVRLLRRVGRYQVNDGIIDSSCFLEKEEGRGLSVTIWEAQSDLDDVRRFNENFGVVCLAAQAFRLEGSRIVRAALVGNLNHCEIFPRLGSGARKRLKAAAKWVHYPDWVLMDHRVEVEHF